MIVLIFYSLNSLNLEILPFKLFEILSVFVALFTFMAKKRIFKYFWCYIFYILVLRIFTF